jgi:hypothetical protein
MTVVDDRNQDDMSRKAGCYLYVDTRLWLDNNLVHRDDGPAVIFPDGVERWYIRGKGNCSRPHSGRSWNWAGVGVAEKV